MQSLLPIAVSALFIVAASNAEAAPLVLSNQDWTITADQERGVLSISQQELGTVLEDVRINLGDQNAIVPLTNWSVEQTSQSQLTIHTVHPITAWNFDISHNMLKISSTATNAVLTAEAPAPQNRIPARVLDPQGFPVDWIGTDEAPLEYGGKETRNQSFLPLKNPEVMYFSLGLVSGPAFHSLFDRKQDAVIQFSDQTTLRRADQDPSLMDVRMPVPGNSYIRLLPNYYTKTLGVPFYVPMDDSYFSTAPMVWSSWTGYYKDVTEKDIVQTTDWLAKNLKPYGFQFVQLDDGYDRGKNGEHYWIENWDKTKFPHGPEWLTDYIKSKGLRAGLWIVPNVYAGALTQHPEWYLRTVEGRHISDYRTPVLDSSNPQVVSFLREEFATLGKWGFEYYKFDGEGSIPQAFPELDKEKLYDKSTDPVVVYRDRMKAIRDTIGPRVFLEGCPAGMPLNGVGYFNSFFNGNDLYDNWQGMYPLFSSINGNAFSNHIFAYVMPGEGIELGKPMTMEEGKTKRLPDVLHEIVEREDPATGLGVTDQEARTIVSFISLTGVAYPVGNVMEDLPQERLKLLQETMPTMPIIPLDLFSRGTDSRNTTFRQTRADYYVHNYPEILDLKVNEKSGGYDVVGFTNWRSEPTNRKISLRDKLGLDPTGSYVAFDFWNQKVLGVFSDEMDIDIEPHDTRVVALHPLLDRPQLIGNSRHITGAYSILNQEWDPAKNKLSGTSETVPDEPYSLWFYLPKGFAVEHLSMVAKGNAEIPEKHLMTGNALMVSFQGQQQPVQWEVSFRASAKK
jgi:hypothetical protein